MKTKREKKQREPVLEVLIIHLVISQFIVKVWFSVPSGHSYLINSKPRKFLGVIFFIVCIEYVLEEGEPRLNTYHRRRRKGNGEELGPVADPGFKLSESTIIKVITWNSCLSVGFLLSVFRLVLIWFEDCELDEPSTFSGIFVSSVAPTCCWEGDGSCENVYFFEVFFH